MRKALTLLATATAGWCCVATAAPELTLRDAVTQGALVRGHTTPGAVITMNGELRPVADDGTFVFAVARAYTGDITLVATDAQGDATQSVVQVQTRQFRRQEINGLPQDKVTPPRSQEVQDRIWTDIQAIRAARGTQSDSTAYAQPFIWPVDGIITGVFGSQRVLNGTPKSPHSGMDIAGPEGEPVKAPADGVVTLWHDDMYFSGGTLIIDHGHGVSTTFIHLSKTHVAEGDVVKQGDVVAEVGMTGRATGPHLHWSMNLGQIRVDPQLLLPPKPSATP